MKRAPDGRNRALWPGPAGLPPSTRGALTRKENRYGSASALPSIAVTPDRTVTVIVSPAWSGAAGRNRTVTGSRQSQAPATSGSSASTVFGSTVRSSDPATGRSKVTVTAEAGSAEPAGVARMTRSGGGPSVATAAAATSRRRRELSMDPGIGRYRNQPWPDHPVNVA